MMGALSERMVIEALQAIDDGQSTAEVLKRYPQYENELRPILETAVALSKVRVAHSLAAQAESRQRMLDQAAALSTSPGQPPALIPWFRRLTSALAPLLVVLIVFVAGLFYASAEALPGDFLYSTKRGVEDLRLYLATNPAAKDALQQSFDEKRILEIGQLLESGRQAEVSFDGLIESIEEDTWIVAGLQVFVSFETKVEGQPMVGRYAWVEATTLDGQLIANTITVEFIPEPSPTPEPTAQEAEVVTPAVTPTVTPTHTPTSTPTATSTSTPAPTSTETPADVIDSPVASPTETPTISGDGNNENIGDDSGNDNENENSEDSNENDEDGNDNQGGNENDGDEDNDNDNDNDDGNSNENDDSNSNGNDNDDDDKKNDNDDDNSNDNSDDGDADSE